MSYDYFVEVRQCKYCKTYFRELDNLGTWECRYHPGSINYDSDIPFYTCCGQKITTHPSSESNRTSVYGTIPLPKIRKRKCGLVKKGKHLPVDGCTARDHYFKDMNHFTTSQFQDFDKDIICAMDEIYPLNDRRGFKYGWEHGKICRSSIDPCLLE